MKSVCYNCIRKFNCPKDAEIIRGHCSDFVCFSNDDETIVFSHPRQISLNKNKRQYIDESNADVV